MMIIIIIYSVNTIKIHTMTWNKIQVHILLIFYNINKHIELLFLKPIQVASIKANIGQFCYNIYTARILLLYREYTTYFNNLKLFTPFKIYLHYLHSKNDNDTVNIKIKTHMKFYL